MTSNTEEFLVIQREKLQKKLQEQRKLIVVQAQQKNNNIYPRSATMRFLTKNPTLMSGLFTEAMLLLTGARLFRLLSALMALVKILHPTLIDAQKQLPAPDRLNTKCDSV